MAIYRLPQYRTTTLAVPGGITNSQTTGIILSTIPADIEVNYAGVLALTWANPVDEDAIEYITYTSINSGTKELGGVTRGQEGFSARAHDNGATIAWVVSKSHINGPADRLTSVDPILVEDPNGNEILLTTYVSSAVNYLRVKNAATGNGPEVQALGDDTNIDLILQAKGTGAYALKGTATTAAEVRLYEDTDNGTNYMGFKAPAAVTTNTTLTLPNGDGTSGQTLTTNASGTLSWTTLGSPTGWTTDTGATWTYLSATTITTADGTLFQKGDRIKLTQTTAKYFVVIGVSGNVITVTGGTDYTVANAAITTQQYSHELNPLGYPTVFNWVPTYLSVTIGNATVVAKFSVVGTMVTSMISVTFGSTTVMAGPDAGVGFPITPSSVYSSFGFAAVGNVIIVDAGTEKYSGTLYVNNTTSWAIFQVRNSSTTYLSHSGISSTVPMTWTTGDLLNTQMTYYI